MAYRASRIIRLVCLGFVIPLVLSMVVYFGFASNYTVGVFSEAGFRGQYEAGIYKYRVLGRLALLKIHEIVENSGAPAIAPRAMFLLDRNGSPVFYTAYFLTNALFLCLACGVLMLLFERLSPPRSVWIGDLLVVLLCLLMAVTQYVVVPYDTMASFFLCLAFGLAVAEQTLFKVILLGLVVVLCALTRETAALILAFYFAVHHRRLLARPFRWTREHSALVFLAACFLGTYLGMRLAFGPGNTVFETIELKANLASPFGLAGLLFFLAVTALLLLHGPGRRESLLFLLASLPYLLFVLVTARLWEMRLWIPLFLSIVVLKVWRMGVEEQRPQPAEQLAG
ncbi:MAG TPA: hypothetical protein DD490_13850 [Acidobacteria bacterium]|nr:hypothetical protein [Acidobacteriota bacterium]